MSKTYQRLLLLFVAFTASLVVCLALIFAVTGYGPSQVPEIAAIGGPFRLTDQNGATLSDQDLRGKPFLVFFGFTYCPDICPTTLFEISEVMRALGPDADKTAALFITVDPERDTPSAMKDYVSSFDPHVKGLTGDAASLAAVAKEYRVYYKKVPLDGGNYTMDHTALVYLMNKDGHFVAPFKMNRTPEAAAADLRRYF